MTGRRAELWRSGRDIRSPRRFRVCVVSPLFLPTVTAGSIAPLSPSDMKLRIRSDTLRGCRAASGPPALAKSPQPPPLPFSLFKWRMAARGRGALVSLSAVMEM